MWWSRVPFDSEVWKASEDWSARHDMSYDLIYGSILEGKSAAEVTELLSSPMTPNKRVTYTNSTPIRAHVVETWLYFIGSVTYALGIGPSSAFLELEITDGKVTSVRKERTLRRYDRTID